MPKPESLYYKKPVMSMGVITFSKTAAKIKANQKNLVEATKTAIAEYANAETHSMTRRMSVVFIEDEKYNAARKEINFNKEIEEGSSNDYICIFNGNSEMIVMLRPASTRQMSLIKFEEWENNQKKGLEKDKEIQEEKLEERKKRMGL